MLTRSPSDGEWRALVGAGQALASCPSETRIVQELCTIAVSAGNHPLVRYGAVSPDSAGDVVEIAAAGADSHAIEPRSLRWLCVTTPDGRTGVTESPYRSAESFSMSVFGQPHGFLEVYSNRDAAFDATSTSMFLALCDLATVAIERLAPSGVNATAYIETAIALNATVEAHDPYTARHHREVAALSTRMAHKMGFTNFETQGVRVAALVHDIGKLGIPMELLTRPTTLRPPESSLIETHTSVGEELLSRIDFPWPIAQTVGQHHERLDGSGYPRGLQAAQILPAARIVMVADVYDAMLADRPYRRGFTAHETLDYLQLNAGRTFDPDAVAALTSICGTCLTAPAFPLPHEPAD